MLYNICYKLSSFQGLHIFQVVFGISIHFFIKYLPRIFSPGKGKRGNGNRGMGTDPIVKKGIYISSIVFVCVRLGGGGVPREW
jgi:hypothetical protein